MYIDDKYYYAFVIGYDLLNDEFVNSSNPENDTTFNFCCKIASEFMESEYYKNNNYSSIEMLTKYVNDNRLEILKDYEKFIGEENLYFEDNKKLLKTCFRGEQPIALIEWKRRNKEYVVAINYIINKDKIYWSRGYYYDSRSSAERDFEKVKNGEYLVDKDKERER